MSYKALYRSYRPQNFNEVVGQDHIVRTFENALKGNKIAHAYLFCGPRGTGKTSVAKLLAKALNCTGDTLICNECPNCLSANQNNHPDIVEMDAASNNGVNEIRDLIDKVKYAPIQGQYKVYIIDEVHMLSTGAFNALLKTLEEPPKNVIFILATTEPHKVLPTIISRCQRFDFMKVDQTSMTNALKNILVKEGVTYQESALKLIVELSDGGMRDALSILDQLLSYTDNNITALEINKIYGITTREDKINLLKNIVNQDLSNALEQINDFDQKGIDFRRLNNDLLYMIKDLIVGHYTNTTLADDMAQFKTLSLSILNQMMDTLLGSINQLKNISNIKSFFELTIIKMMSFNSTSLTTEKQTITSILTEETEAEDSESINIPHETEISSLNTEDISTPSIKLPVEDITNTNKEAEVVAKLDVDYYLGLLVGADKNKRKELEDHWDLLKDYMYDIDYARHAKALLDSKLIAVGDNYLFVSSSFASVVEEINNNSILLEEFSLKVFEDKYKIICIGDDENKSLISTFRERHASQTLPNKTIVQLSEVNKPTQQDKLEELFGEGMFEVV